jgi:hypothetical protein
MWVVRVTSGSWFGLKIQHSSLIETESLATAGFARERKMSVLEREECFRDAKGCFRWWSDKSRPVVRGEEWGKERGGKERKKEEVWSLIQNKSQIAPATRLNVLLYQKNFIVLKKNLKDTWRNAYFKMERYKMDRW